MASENEVWIMRGLDWDDPYRIRSWQELISWINEVGFCPFLKMKYPDFLQKNMYLRYFGGPATHCRIPGYGEN